VLTRLAIALLFAGQILAAAGAASASGRRVAQAAPAAQSIATDRAFLAVSRLLGQRNQRVAEKRSLAATYESQLRELDRLKQSKASWRRDRQIRSKKAESQATAARLSRVDAELRALDSQLRVQRQLLVSAISNELSLATTGTPRRAALVKMRSDVMAALRPRARKIILPDDSLDELADPDELTEQIALIAQAEKELGQERQVLRQREDRYTRWAVLREQRERAGQMSDLDDDQVRRSSGRSGKASRENGGGGGTGASDEGAPSTSGDTPPPDDQGDAESPSSPDAGFETSSVVLADVVDSTTIDALRRAGRSSNPRARADAAARARKQVEARLDRLKKSRALIQNHLNKLRAQ